MISSRKRENVDDAVKKLKELGVDASGTVCDVSKRDDTINLVKTVIIAEFCYLTLSIFENFIFQKY